jgi:hypothetical protein
VRSDSLASVIVMAAARIASPMAWPPISRIASGKLAEASATWMAFGDACDAGEGLGEGSTCGKPEATLVLAGFGSPGTPGAGTQPGGNVDPGGSVPGGSEAPSPAVPVGVGVGEDEVFDLTRTDSDTDAAWAARGDVALARSLTVEPAAFCGMEIFARSSSRWPEPRCTVQVACPVVGQTVKTGESRLGLPES